MKASNSANGYESNFIYGSENQGKDKYVYLSTKGMWEQDIEQTGSKYKFKVFIDAYTDNGYVKTICVL